MAGGKENVTLPADGYFYDELPWLVRTIDFSKPAGEFTAQLAASTLKPKKENNVIQPATHQIKERHHRIQAGEDFIQVDREDNRRCGRARGRHRPFHSRSRWTRSPAR